MRLMQLIRTLLSLAVALLLVGNLAIAQSGYSIQLAAYSSPATQKHFEALRQPVQQVKIDDKTYLYIIDGFVSYIDADKIRKTAVGKGFPDAIALKTASSRIPALKVKPYAGPTDGGPVPDAAGATPAPAPQVVANPTPQPTSQPAAQPGKQTPPPSAPGEVVMYGSSGKPVTPTPTPAPTTPPGKTTTPPGKTTPTPTPVAATPAPSDPKTQPAAPTTPPKQTTTPARQPKQQAADPYNGTPFTATDPDPNVNPNPPALPTTTRSAARTPAPTATGGGYDQNFNINENSVKGLVSNGSVTSGRVTENNLTPNAGVVFFDYNKAMLRPTAEQEMNRLATKLTGNIAYTVEIRAHTDAIGPDAYNDELSTRRGKAAMIYLLRKGVPANRVTFKAFGESRPLADNTTPDGGDNAMGRQINRRVELLVKDAYGTVVEIVTLP